MSELPDPENAKDMIFTEENVNKWFTFSHQMSIQDLIESIRYYKNSVIPIPSDIPITRSEARCYMEGYAGSYDNFVYNNAIRRFVECCFVEAFRKSSDTTYEWLKPRDISEAIRKYNIRFDHGEDFEKDVIKDKCESLQRLGYIEEHPDDEPNTENTRYRVKY